MDTKDRYTAVPIIRVDKFRSLSFAPRKAMINSSIGAKVSNGEPMMRLTGYHLICVLVFGA